MPWTRKPSYLNFGKAAYAWKPDVDYRKHPEPYKVGKGEQGVLICEPYKSELTPHWRFKTPEIARESGAAIYKMFEAYSAVDDFVGADMARKFLQMGYTRARRYANYKGGRKYDKQLPKDRTPNGVDLCIPQIKQIKPITAMTPPDQKTRPSVC